MRALATIEPERAYSPSREALVPRTLLVAAISADPLRENRLASTAAGFSRKEKAPASNGAFPYALRALPTRNFLGDGGRRGGARIKTRHKIVSIRWHVFEASEEAPPQKRRTTPEVACLQARITRQGFWQAGAHHRRGWVAICHAIARAL